MAMMTVTVCKELIDTRGINKFISDKIRLVASDEVIDLIFEDNTIINM